jgi:hypothetical protein
MCGRMGWALCVSLSLIGVASAEPPGQREDGRRKEALVKRQEQLVQTLKTGKFFDVLRAAEELAAMDKLDPLVTRDLVALMKNAPDGQRALESVRLVDALAASGPDGVPVILRALRTAEWKGDNPLLLSLGRMGPSAKAAVPLLRDRLKDPKTAVYSKADLRIVLANIGSDPKEGLQAIRGWMQALDTHAYPFSAVVQVRPREWLTREVIDTMVKDPGDKDQKLEGDGVIIAAELFGVMGDRAASAIRELEAAQKTAIKDRKNVAISATLGLARIDPKNQDAILRRLFKGCPDAFRALERVTILGVLMETPYLLIDSRLSLQLARMVEDKDAEVAEGAAALLWWAGLAGRDAFPRLLKYVRSDATPARRAVAANVLGRVATFDRLAELEAAHKDEKAAEVRRELQLAIDDIRSVGKEGWDEAYLGRRYPLKLWP